MLKFDDPKWAVLKGGYAVAYRPVSALSKLEAGVNPEEAWKELWNGLHHQGDLGEASYAAVPHLVRIHKERGNLGWNLFALTSTIEIERHRKGNPPLPGWVEYDYAAGVRLVCGALDGKTHRSIEVCGAGGRVHTRFEISQQGSHLVVSNLDGRSDFRVHLPWCHRVTDVEGALRVDEPPEGRRGAANVGGAEVVASTPRVSLTWHL